jgi:hypothetical protein
LLLYKVSILISARLRKVVGVPKGRDRKEGRMEGTRQKKDGKGRWMVRRKEGRKEDRKREIVRKGEDTKYGMEK